MDLDSAFIFSFKSLYAQLKGLNPLLLSAVFPMKSSSQNVALPHRSSWL